MIHSILNTIDDIKNNKTNQASVEVSLNSSTWYPLALRYASQLILIRNTRKAVLVFNEKLGSEGLCISVQDSVSI